jgi:hypothetical protein
MSGEDQPGILEHLRKQAGMTVLAGLFDSLRRYRKEHGRLMLWYITNFLSDGRLIKIGGPDKARYVPLLRRPDTVEYDVIVDDTPTSPNMKEQVWAALVQMMPILSRVPIPPQMYIELLRYSPLPETLVEKLAMIAQQAQQQAMQGQQTNPMAIAAQGRAAYDQARAKLAEAQAQKVGMDAAIGSAQARAENARTQVEAARAALEAEETRAKIESLRAGALANLAKAGATQHDVRTDQFLAVLEMLDKMVSWNQPAPQPTAQQPQAA